MRTIYFLENMALLLLVCAFFSCDITWGRLTLAAATLLLAAHIKKTDKKTL